MIPVTVLAKIKAGATVRVFEKIKEGDKERIGRFEGLVISRKHGSEAGASFTVRTTIAGVHVEKGYPINCMSISKVEILSSPKKVHRSKIYYVRDISRKSIRQKTAVKTQATDAPAKEVPEKKAE